jgi:hypothetical protein
MMKTALLIGTPSLVTLFASAYSQLLENIDFFFLVSVVALLVAIVPRLIEAKARY